MKTSNKLLLAVGLIILACLVGYNFALKKVYTQGEFRSPYYGMHKLNLSNFKIVNNQAADFMGIQIKHDAKYQVWVRPDVEDMLKITSDGRTLSIKKSTLPKRDYYYDNSIIITCPDIDSVVAGGPAVKGTQEAIDNYDPYIRTKITGFVQPHLGVRANFRTLILLDNNKLNRLNTLLGDDKAGRGLLTITDNNKIGLADLNVKGKSVLTLYGQSVAKSINHISDSASLMLHAAPVKLFVQP
ncbi:hypothetical protein [Mucilaginibacter sp. CSA2-8R]|uniref:hypothetical protein n=1 Tax=Mucilaginibacter sp. CSA2-8R TaxID=3141542 RepID=UPI00315DA427